MNSDWLRSLQDRAKKFLSPAGTLLTTPAYPGLYQGQVWSTHGSPSFPGTEPLPHAEEDTLLIVVIRHHVADLNGHSLHLVAPLFQDTPMAGPTDVLLPKEVFGHHKAVALGAAITILQDSLELCLGALPDPWPEQLAAALVSMESGADLPRHLNTGVPFLDESDIRFGFQEELVDKLGYLQAPALAWAESCNFVVVPAWAEEQTRGPSLLAKLNAFLFAPFEIPEPAPAALLAADAKATRPLESHTYVSPEQGLAVQISEAEKAGFCAIEVLDDPNHRLEGSLILDESGMVLGMIERGTAFFQCRTKEGLRIAFQLQDGTLVLFQKADTPDV